MKLVLYSGYDNSNHVLDQALVRLTAKDHPTVTFIPASHDVPDFEYQYFCETFGPLGVKNIAVFHPDLPYSPGQAREAIQADIIYLGGGNTFHLLKSIKSHHFDRLLKQFVRRGGVLSGLSAGSIVMTPTIATASYPSFDRDDNKVGIKSLDALNLLPFEIFPHYNPATEYARELKKQSKKISWPRYGIADGSGIVVNGERITFYGDIWGYVGGREYRVGRLTAPVEK